MEEMSSKEHRMKVVNTYEDGSQEWLCDTCGRRFIMSLPPNYRRTLLEEGDGDVVHTGSTSPLPGVTLELGRTRFDQEDPWLAPYEEWLENRGGDK